MQKCRMVRRGRDAPMCIDPLLRTWERVAQFWVSAEIRMVMRNNVPCAYEVPLSHVQPGSEASVQDGQAAGIVGVQPVGVGPAEWVKLGQVGRR